MKTKTADFRGGNSGNGLFTMEKWKKTQKKTNLCSSNEKIKKIKKHDTKKDTKNSSTKKINSTHVKCLASKRGQHPGSDVFFKLGLLGLLGLA